MNKRTLYLISGSIVWAFLNALFLENTNNVPFWSLGVLAALWGFVIEFTKKEAKELKKDQKELKELEDLENPDLKYLTPSIGVLLRALKNIFMPNLNKEKIIELRTKKRLAELGIDIDKEPQKYYQILKEEEKKFLNKKSK